MDFSPHNKPIKSTEMSVLKQLNSRMTLPQESKQKYNNLVKGYYGQVHFNNLLQDKLTTEPIILNDLLLSENNSQFQIDNLLLFQKRIHLFEIKNFEGDFIIKNDKWYSLSGNEISNPVYQLKRAESLFRRHLLRNSFSYPVEAYVVFVNPSFTLYQAPPDLPIILPTQLTRLIQTLNKSTSHLNNSNYQLASQIVTNHITKSSQENLPSYNYHLLEKGILCPRLECSHYLIPFNNRELVCKDCNYRENIDFAILRSTKEFNLLFPNTKITTTIISEWCKVIGNKKRINSVLMNNLKCIQNGKYTYYTFD